MATLQLPLQPYDSACTKASGQSPEQLRESALQVAFTAIRLCFALPFKWSVAWEFVWSLTRILH